MSHLDHRGGAGTIHAPLYSGMEGGGRVDSLTQATSHHSRQDTSERTVKCDTLFGDSWEHHRGRRRSMYHGRSSV